VADAFFAHAVETISRPFSAAFGPRVSKSTFGGPGVSDCSVPGNHLSVLTSPSEAAILQGNNAVSVAEQASALRRCVVRRGAQVQAAARAARALNETIRQQGIAFDSVNEALRALQWRQSAIASEGVLMALAFYLNRGGGSRGARTVCSRDGDCAPKARSGSLEDMRFISERAEDRAEQIHVRFEAGAFLCSPRPIRRRDRDYRPFFERDWPDYLNGAIHDPSA
jgi:hypothetical protein